VLPLEHLPDKRLGDRLLGHALATPQRDGEHVV
jgi:hypothetical protein